MATKRQNKLKTEAPPPGRAAVSGPEGTVYMFGMGDFGQLGIDAVQRKYPGLVPELPFGGKEAMEIQCGGLHTVVLLKDGTMWTYGNNDDLALGRDTPDEDAMKKPGKVEMSDFIIQVTAGDMHTAALTREGHVYDSSGKIGLLDGCGKADVGEPQRVKVSKKLQGAVEEDAIIQKIASGSNHLVMLADDGLVYTVGSGEQGQLGRPPKKLLCPAKRDIYNLTAKGVRPLEMKNIEDIWAGEFSTYLRTATGSMYVFGLNNYGQLGIEVKEGEDPTVHSPTKSIGLTITGVKWVQISAGEHHAIALDSNGAVYSLGRNEDGRLGLGPDSQKRRSVWQATRVPKLEGVACVQVGCGLSTSYAISKDRRQLYAWGFGENFQLATGQDGDEPEPNVCNFKKGQLTCEGVVFLSAGAQHVGILRRSISRTTASMKTEETQKIDEEEKEPKMDDTMELVSYDEFVRYLTQKRMTGSRRDGRTRRLQ